MSSEGRNINQLIQSGELTIDKVRELFNAPPNIAPPATEGGDDSGSQSGTPSTPAVTIEGWRADYNSGSGQFSESCTVLALPGGPAITGAGLLAYSADGRTLYCCDYADGFASSSMIFSIGTALFKPQVIDKVQGVVFGTVLDGQRFFFEQSLLVGCSD